MSYDSRFVRTISGKIGWRYDYSYTEPRNQEWIKKHGSKTHDIYDAPQSH